MTAETVAAPGRRRPSDAEKTILKFVSLRSFYDLTRAE